MLLKLICYELQKFITCSSVLIMLLTSKGTRRCPRWMAKPDSIFPLGKQKGLNNFWKYVTVKYAQIGCTLLL